MKFLALFDARFLISWQSRVISHAANESNHPPDKFGQTDKGTTELENPGSVVQLKSYLIGEGIEDQSNLKS